MEDQIYRANKELELKILTLFFGIGTLVSIINFNFNFNLVRKDFDLIATFVAH